MANRSKAAAYNDTLALQFDRYRDHADRSNLVTEINFPL